MADTRTFQDRDFLVWEVYATGGAHGFSDTPHVIFHCLTRRDIRPRVVAVGADEAEAQRIVARAEPAELLAMLDGARQIA